MLERWENEARQVKNCNVCEMPGELWENKLKIFEVRFWKYPLINNYLFELMT